MVILDWPKMLKEGGGRTSDCLLSPIRVEYRVSGFFNSTSRICATNTSRVSTLNSVSDSCSVNARTCSRSLSVTVSCFSSGWPNRPGVFPYCAWPGSSRPQPFHHAHGHRSWWYSTLYAPKISGCQ